MNDIFFSEMHRYYTGEFCALRDEEGFYGYGATKRDAAKDLIRQEQDAEDAAQTVAEEMEHATLARWAKADLALFDALDD